MSVDPSTSESGLRVRHGTRLENLVEGLIEVLAEESADPFAEEIIVIPNSGIGDWLQYRVPEALGARLGGRGIFANFRMLTASAFVARVLERPESESRWTRDRLLWFVHRAIDDVGRDSVPGSGDNRLRTADVVADLFDRYAVHRPTMLDLWKSGRATDGVELDRTIRPDLRWQVNVYRRVCELIEDETAAEALGALQRRLSAGDVPAELPRRVSLVGFASLGPVLRNLLEVLSSSVRVEVFLLHPLAGEWDVLGDRDRTGGLRLRHGNPQLENVHPLTARWGRMAIETRQLVSADKFSLGGSDWGSSLLGTLQSALTTRASGSLTSIETESALEVLRHGDGTLQIHACHGRARQVEVLRDALLHRLDADATLHLDDILIICPDIEAFAPLIPAIFRSGTTNSDSGPPPLRARVAELDVTEEAPVVDAFMGILQLSRGRLGATEVLGLLSSPVVANRFDLNDEAVARLADLADDLHVAFGIDEAHRTPWGVPEDLSEGTWRFGLTRLMMGLAVAAPAPILGPGDVVPFDDVSVTDVPVFGALAEFFSKLESLIDQIGKPHSVGEWMGIFQQMVDDFTRSGDPDSGRTQLLDAFDAIEGDANEGGIGQAVTFSMDEITFVLRAHLTRRSRRPIFRSGEITVSRVPPVQGVPYRVIALLGAEETIFASGGSSGDDVLSLHPCIGEPDSSVQGRQALLNAVLAARDALIITCEGADIGTNKDVPLAVPVQELLEACVPLLKGREFGTQRVLVRHPRQNFHPNTLRAGLVFDDRPFTFDPGALDVHRHLDGQTRSLDPPAIDGPIGNRMPTDVRSLVSLIENPVNWFVESVADIRIDSLDDSDVDEVLPVEINSLEYSQLARQLLEHLRSSEEFRSGKDTSPVFAMWSETVLAAGLVPPGALGPIALQTIFDEVTAFMAVVPRTHFDSDMYHSVEVSFDPFDGSAPADGSPPVLITGEISDIVGHDLVRLLFRRPNEALYLGIAVELALLVRSNPVAPYRAYVVTRGISKEAVIEPVIISVRGDDPEIRLAHATRFLQMVAAVAYSSAQSLLPVFPRASAHLARGRTKKARDDFEKDCEYSTAVGYFFGATSWEEVLADGRLRDWAKRIWGTFDDIMSVMALSSVVAESAQ